MKERYESVNKLPRKNVNRAVSLCPNSQRNAFKAQQISGRVGESTGPEGTKWEGPRIKLES